jgi:hypothetical protein
MQYLSYNPEITPNIISKLQQYVNEFISLIATPNNQNCANEFTIIIQNIAKIIFGETIDSSRINRLINSLMTIRSISNCPVTIYESDGKQQISVVSTLSSLLCKTLTDNFHSVRKECKSFDKKNNKCKFGNPFIEGTCDHLYTCSFHMYDSLSVHLVLACLYNTLWAIDTNLDDKTIMMACFLGLYHDIGKPLSVETYEFKNSIITGFPGHGEIGAMLVQMHWTQTIEQHISKKDYMNVVTAILRHMCGYHGNADNSNSYKRDLLLLEQPVIKKLLTINRMGDHFGKLVDKTPKVQKKETEKTGEETNNENDEAKEESVESFLYQQTLFERQMNSSVPFDLQTVLKSHTNKKGFIVPNKVVVYLIGTSGSGKTYFANEMLKLFPNNLTLISRDECIAKVCVGICKRLENEDYVRMYKIYECGKRVSSITKNKSKNKPKNGNMVDSVETKENDKAIQDLIEAQISWNNYAATKGYPLIKVHDEKEEIPTIHEDVKELYETKISKGMKDSNRFLVLDTFMNCFPLAIESNVPNDLKKYFRVHVHIQSYAERKESTIAETLDQQIKVSGPYGINDPIHPDGFRNNKKSFASLSAEIGVDGPLPRSTFTSKFRPHLVAGICMRTQNDSIGYEETFDCLKALVST